MKIFFYFFLYFSIFYKQNNHIIKYIFVIFARPSIMHMDCNLKYTTKKKQLTTMAEIIENKTHEIPSMAKANAGLTLG